METNGTVNMTSDYFYTHTSATEDEGRGANVFILAMSYMIFKIGKSLKIIFTIGHTLHVRRSEQSTRNESFTKWLLGVDESNVLASLQSMNAKKTNLITPV